MLDSLAGIPQAMQLFLNESQHWHSPGLRSQPPHLLPVPDCMAIHSSNTIITIADTTVIGLISGNDEMAYREEVRAQTS